MLAMPLGVDAGEVAQPAPVVLALERQALVLDARIDAHHPVVDFVDGDARSKQIGREDDAAVRQPDLAVLDAFGSRLALFFLEAVGVVHADPRRDLLVSVVVAEPVPQAELAGRRQPLDRVGLRVHPVVELRRAHAERAQVVGEHRHVLDLGMELAFEPDAGGVRAPEELVGNQAVVHAEPVRELTLCASHGGQRRDADTHAHEPVEGPASGCPRPRPAPDRPAMGSTTRRRGSSASSA